MNLTTDLLNVSDKMIDLTLGKILHRIFSLLSGRKVFFFLYEKKKTTVCPCDEILAHRVSESQINNYLNIKKKKHNQLKHTKNISTLIAFMTSIRDV